MTIYRRFVLDVACECEEADELTPALLTTLGAIETPFIGGTGMQILSLDEKPGELRFSQTNFGS
jgi:hypothetical protein|tara:strand:- start:1806 stop:1997 length:192 start_codon:yes stop_codon:yes gene_type:complete